MRKASVGFVLFAAAVSFAACSGGTDTTGGEDAGSEVSVDADAATTLDSGVNTGDADASVDASDAAEAGDADSGLTCPDNTRQTSKFVVPNYGAGCQACLEAKCCDKLKACFNQQPKDADSGALPDCNDYKQCIDVCNTQHPLMDDGGAPPELAQCYDDCDSAVNGTQAEAVRVAFELLSDSCLSDVAKCANECAPP